jgi:very-short-patch-repair endonuclease
MGTHARPIGRVDLVFRELGILIEYEGNQHRTDRWQWNIDIGRYEDFTVDGYVVIRVTGAAMRRPREVVCRVDAALRSHGYRGPAPRFSPEWCLLFEQSPHVR